MLWMNSRCQKDVRKSKVCGTFTRWNVHKRRSRLWQQNGWIGGTCEHQEAGGEWWLQDGCQPCPGVLRGRTQQQPQVQLGLFLEHVPQQLMNFIPSCGKRLVILELSCNVKVIASTSDKASPNQRLYQLHWWNLLQDGEFLCSWQADLFLFRRATAHKNNT